MTSDCNNLGLVLSSDTNAFPKLSDVPGGLITIEEGHVIVHEDKFVAVRILLPNCLLDRVHCLFTVVAGLNSTFTICKAQDHKKAVNDIAVELFIIYYQDVALSCFWNLE